MPGRVRQGVEGTKKNLLIAELSSVPTRRHRLLVGPEGQEPAMADIEK